ncbi:hypothetical protein QJS10_CPB12g00556 [Acorus calamus]|uniref:Uncharacterized protein n=1 Tax=Acorus calamus TaxID=4465 RepID=A0AAV9DMV9_ACOCL|nr:hypothetical protein QJS10_CPB12g00562 [Acorus calamus]KAK1302547.1 hypothetical protein QJS10_CPB12g00556 [Acorus calamus]
MATMRTRGSEGEMSAELQRQRRGLNLLRPFDFGLNDIDYAKLANLEPQYGLIELLD